MAIQIQKELGNGFIANYWKISELNYNVAAQQLHIGMVLYADSQARVDGKDPAFEGHFPIHDVDSKRLVEIFSADKGNPISAIYGFLKTLPEFDGATDLN